MPTQNAIHHFSREDVQSLLEKVQIFNSRIGEYRKHHFGEQQHCTVFLSNGFIFFTTDELLANKKEELELAMMVEITGRFTLYSEK